MQLYKNIFVYFAIYNVYRYIYTKHTILKIVHYDTLSKSTL
jgi:hypothetical protein